MTEIKTDLIFDPEKKLAFDLYIPAKPNNKILIFWHGGGWFRGDKSAVTDLGKKMAEAGFLTFIPNYRLAPKYNFPSANHDSQTFVQWLIQSSYFTDNKEIVQIGASVGGTMALELSMLHGFKTVTWSAPSNFSSWMEEHHDVIASVDAKTDFDETNPENIRDAFYKYFISTYVGEPISNDKLQRMDLLSSYNGQIGKVLLFNSTHELVNLTDTLDFIQKIAADDHQITLQTIPGTGHAMDYADQVIDLSLSYLQD